MIEVEVGYKKGIPLFNMLTFERYRFRNLKERMEMSDTTFTCCILINGIQTCKKELQGVSSTSAFELLIEHQKNAHNVKYGAEFLGEDLEIGDQNSESDIVGDESSESDSEDESSESDSEDKKNCVECVEKNTKIQTLEISKIKLETEVASAKKALEKSKAESKVELEKVENQLQTEVASKESLEESLSKYRKLKQLLATKVFQSNPSNEDLDILLNLEIEKLFEKYEQIMKVNDSNIVKVEEGNGNNTIKNKKLNLQILQRELYEKELDEIMDVLKMPSEDRIYTNILPIIKDLLEKVDTNHYTNAVENLINE